VFARVRPLRAGEVLRGQQTKSDTTCIITIRTLPGLTTDCRALWQGQYLYINGIIDPEGRGIEMEIMCRGEH
jgi:SPP1 family predicted phage head-tail adaptor